MSKKTNLFHKDFVMVIICQIISLFGNGILRFALPLYILNESGSPVLFGLVSAAAFVPMILMNLCGGIIADRVNKQKIMVFLDVATAGAMFCFILLSGWFSIVPLIVIVLMIIYGVQGAYQPTVQSCLPLLMVRENLTPSNAVINLVISLSQQLLGPVIGGVLFGFYGLLPVVYISAGCFAASAILAFFIKIPNIHIVEEGSALQIIKRDMTTSFKYIIVENPVIFKVTLLFFFANICLSSLLTVGIPVIVTNYLDLSNQLYGLANGALAAGGVAGGLFAGFFGKKVDIKYAYVYLIIGAIGLLPMAAALFLGLPTMVTFVIIAISSFITMFGTQTFTIQKYAFIQAQAPVEIIGKVLSCIMALCLCAQPIGQALYGVLFEKFIDSPAIIIAIASVVALTMTIVSKSIFKQLKETETEHRMAS